MKTITTIDKKSSLKQIKEFCQSRGISPIGNKSYKKSWLLGYKQWLEKQSTSIVPVNQPIELPKLTDLYCGSNYYIDLPGQIELVTDWVKEEVYEGEFISEEEFQQTQQVNLDNRKKLIKEMFKSVGFELGCRIKVERKHVYETMEIKRLVEHMLYWYLDSKVSRRDLNTLWKNEVLRNNHLNKFVKQPVVSNYLKQLF